MPIFVPPGFYGIDHNIPQLRTGDGLALTAGTLILPFNLNRTSAIITNNDSVNILIGTHDDMKASFGHALLPGNSISIDTPVEVWGAGVGRPAAYTTYEEWYV